MAERGERQKQGGQNGYSDSPNAELSKPSVGLHNGARQMFRAAKRASCGNWRNQSWAGN